MSSRINVLIPLLFVTVIRLDKRCFTSCADDRDFLDSKNAQATARKTYPRQFWDGLPKSFDARAKWYGCPSIGRIQDQGNCKSSHAVSVASAVSDRICIHSGGKRKPKISAQQILSCCYLCGYGCDGGDHSESWYFYQRHGIVSGGGYDSDEGCQSYTIEPCEHSPGAVENPCSNKTTYTPECKFDCDDPGNGFDYVKDHHRGSYYRVPAYLAMKEIYEKGPITASFHMYQDFINYRSGVYTYDPSKSGNYVGTQTVKIVGWGEDDDHTPYWLAANSFNAYWGESGFFRILRGGNECYIEENMYGGLPL